MVVDVILSPLFFLYMPASTPFHSAFDEHCCVYVDAMLIFYSPIKLYQKNILWINVNKVENAIGELLYKDWENSTVRECSGRGWIWRIGIDNYSSRVKFICCDRDGITLEIDVYMCWDKVNKIGRWIKTSQLLISNTLEWFPAKKKNKHVLWLSMWVLLTSNNNIFEILSLSRSVSHSSQNLSSLKRCRRRTTCESNCCSLRRSIVHSVEVTTTHT